MTKQYVELCNRVLANGVEVENRTGVNTITVFGESIKYDLQKGFPIPTTRKGLFKSAFHELNWMLHGLTNVDYLNENGVRFWDIWTDEDGELGPVYGELWRRFPGKNGRYYDQIQLLLERLKKNPMSRRHVVSLWYPEYLPDESISPQQNVLAGLQALAPCHWMFEVNCQPYEDTYKINLHVHLRSNDLPAGHPVNVVFYSLLTHMLAQQCDYKVGELWVTMTDAHVYIPQVEILKEQISREPYPLPTLKILRKPESIFDYKVDDFELENYQHHPAVRYPVAL